MPRWIFSRFSFSGVLVVFNNYDNKMRSKTTLEPSPPQRGEAQAAKIHHSDAATSLLTTVQALTLPDHRGLPATTASQSRQTANQRHPYDAEREDRETTACIALHCIVCFTTTAWDITSHQTNKQTNKPTKKEKAIPLTYMWRDMRDKEERATNYKHEVRLIKTNLSNKIFLGLPSQHISLLWMHAFALFESCVVL